MENYMSDTSPMKEFDEWMDRKYPGEGDLTMRKNMSSDQVLIAKIAWRASRGISEKESRELDRAIGYTVKPH